MMKWSAREHRGGGAPRANQDKTQEKQLFMTDHGVGAFAASDSRSRVPCAAPSHLPDRRHHQHRVRLLARAALLSLCAGLAGCLPSGAAAPTAPAPEQGNLCEVTAWRKDAVARSCKPGQKVVFLPESFGNEQLPVIFAAVNCDLRYEVALTRGAVACIYAPLKDAAQPQAEAARQ